MRIYVDMDDVLCDWMGAYDEARERVPGQKYPQAQMDFFRKLKPLPNAIEGMAIVAIFILKPRIATSQPVTVVPIFAPMMTPIDCSRVIRPAWTKPTSITVVALDDWIAPVTINPVTTPANR